MSFKPDKSFLEIFNDALELRDADERARFLQAACGGDQELRAKIEKLLRANQKAGGFLGDPTRKPEFQGPGLELSEKPGDRIGRYKLLQQIGEGGCGVVYMAEQEEPVRRKVALKVIKLGMDTKQVVGRFEAERQALALMDHPNIAKVLDAGATDSGRPYFVMELVQGTRITHFCDQKQLSARERLELAMQVCSAIQHAHHKGIVHRDLKPSNILVTTVDPDGSGVPKVIDFGIAKATTNQRLTDKTLFTAFQQFIGTPAYMSPEQAEMSGVDIDTRTDIYSLGVVVYELLTGKPPFGSEELLRFGLDEMRRTIREREPAKPSTRLSTLADEEATTVAQARRTELPVLLKAVRGDLDWIVMKCLEKDRNRRYESANDLALDIRRYLGNEPVVARPASNLYRFQKLLSRNRAISALSAVLLISLVAGGVTLWRSERHLRRAVVEKSKALETEKEMLYQALLSQARAQRVSGRIGQRFETLETIRRAAQIRPSLELRNEAAAALARTDLRRVRELRPYFNARYSMVDFSPDFANYICGSPTGFVLRATSNSMDLRNFTCTGSNGAEGVRFSQDARWIAVGNPNRDLEIWSVEGTEPVWTRRARNRDVLIPAFRPDGTGFACVSAEGQVCLRRFDAGEKEDQQILMSVESGSVAMSFAPDGEDLAVAHRSGLELWNLSGATRRWRLDLEVCSLEPAWRPDGQLLAVGEFANNAVVLVHAADGKVERTFDGHSLPVVHTAFHPDGQVLASLGADRWLRFWSIQDGTEILRCPAAPRGVRFSQNGRLVGFAPEDGTAAVFEWAHSTVCREFLARPNVAYILDPASRVSPDGRLVVTTDGRETRLWDTRAERQVASFEAKGPDPLFEAGRQTLLYNMKPYERTSSPANADYRVARREYEWIEQPGQNPSLKLGPEQLLPSDAAIHLHDITPGGEFWLLHRTHRAWVAWPEGQAQSEKLLVRKPGFMEGQVTLSPDGRWLVGEKEKKHGAYIWDTSAKKWAPRLPAGGPCEIVFTPDGRWLLLAEARKCQAWEVGTWRPKASWPANLTSHRGHVSSSPDSKLAAIVSGHRSLQLVSLNTWQEVVTLELPSDLYVERANWSPDGHKLYVLGARQRLFVWNLPELRKELAALGLDWKD